MRVVRGVALVSFSGACALAACSVSLDGLSGGPSAADGGGDSAASAGHDSGIVVANADAGGGADPGGGADAGSEAGPPPSGKIVFAQQAESATGSSTLDVPLASVAPHDTLIVGFTSDNNTTPRSVSDSLGNTFVRVAGAANIFDINGYLYVAYDVKPGATDKVTIVINGAVTELNATVDEYAGLAANGLEIAQANEGGATGKDGASVALTTTEANTLVYGYAYAATDMSDGTAIAGTGFVTRASGDGQVSEERILSQAGPITVSATMTTGTAWLMLGAAFAGQ